VRLILLGLAIWSRIFGNYPESLPKSLIVLGGGAVGCELGQILGRFGVDVTTVEAGDRLLPAEEPEASQVVQAAFTAEGIQVVTGAAVQQVMAHQGSIVVKPEGDTELAGERLLVATGRTVDLSGLGLESAGLNSTAKIIQVDERMRAADGIWAMGDVTGKGMFTHVALYQSAIIAADILGEHHPPARYDAVRRAIFTDPEVGAVGQYDLRLSHVLWRDRRGGGGVRTWIVNRSRSQVP
jgi:pyruvate/2-oxoglutarate dehydrogenase complex dihydrolipoamide dehydrogenase (E3) component